MRQRGRVCTLVSMRESEASNKRGHLERLRKLRVICILARRSRVPACISLEQQVVARSMTASVTPAVPLIASSSVCTPAFQCERCTLQGDEVSVPAVAHQGRYCNHTHPRFCRHGLMTDRLLVSTDVFMTALPDTDRTAGSDRAGEALHAQRSVQMAAHWRQFVSAMFAARTLGRQPVHELPSRAAHAGTRSDGPAYTRLVQGDAPASPVLQQGIDVQDCIRRRFCEAAWPVETLQPAPGT